MVAVVAAAVVVMVIGGGGSTQYLVVISLPVSSNGNGSGGGGGACGKTGITDTANCFIPFVLLQKLRFLTSPKAWVAVEELKLSHHHHHHHIEGM